MLLEHFTVITEIRVWLVEACHTSTFVVWVIEAPVVVRSNTTFSQAFTAMFRPNHVGVDKNSFTLWKTVNGLSSSVRLVILHATNGSLNSQMHLTLNLLLHRAAQLCETNLYHS